MDVNLVELPEELPQPKDDGESNHLLGKILPDVTLQSSIGESIDLSKVKSKMIILYFFPMMADPKKELPTGWDNIPGARGCTPQNITINEHIKDLKKFNVTIFGISTQTIDELIKLSILRKLSQPLISDRSLKFQEKLNIPTFQVGNDTMYKRLTLVVKESKIIKVFYPIFPPNKHIFQILEWLEKIN